MDRFDALQAFARVVEAGSFTRAAQTLHLSKTTVTQLIQQLEARLGVKLLHRTTRQVKVTADGAAYYERVVRLLADLADADSVLSSASAAPRGRLRVDVPSPLARMILMPALPAFHARYPDIQLDMGVSDRRVDVIGDNVDCVLRGGALTDSSLLARLVGELKMSVYAAPSYLDRAGTPAHPRELEGDTATHRVVGFLRAQTGTVVPFTMRRSARDVPPGAAGSASVSAPAEERVDVQGRYAVAVDDGNAYLAAGLAGMGLLWLPHYMAEPHVARGELRPVFEAQGWRFESMPLYLVLPPNRHPSARLRVFIDWVEGLLAQHAPVAGLAA